MQFWKACANSGRISISRLFFSSRRSLLALTASMMTFFELWALDGVKDVRHPLAVEAVPVALVGQVPEGVGRGLGQLEHVFDGEPLYLWNSSN